MSNFTLCIHTENSPGVLHRITVLFTRRKLNIESLTVSETERQGVSRFTITVNAERALVEKVSRQLARIIEVLGVSVSEDSQLIAKEIALIEVTAADIDSRQRVTRIVRERGGQFVGVGEKGFVVEKTGTENEVNALQTALAPFGITQFVRSGRIALLRNGGSGASECANKPVAAA